MRIPTQLAAVTGVVVLAAILTDTAAAQTFTGGLRGAVRDANGVIPGVTVQLVNEATNQTREAVSNDQGEYNFAAVPPGTYTVKASLTGFKTYENQGVRIGAQQFITLDIALEVGQLQETITVTGAVAAHRYVERLDRRRHRLAAAADAAERRPVGVPVRGHGPDGHRLGRRAVQPPAGSDQRVAAVARRRHAPRQQLPGRRRADHRHAQPRVGQPVDRGARRRRRAGAHLRRGDGPHRRRHVQRRHQVGHERLARQRLLPDPAAVGHGEQLLLGARRRAAAGNLLPPGRRRRSAVPSSANRTFFWFSTEGYGSNTTRNGALRFPTARERTRRLLADRSTAPAGSSSSTTR